MELEEIENIVRIKVERDLEENPAQDPFGNSIYLYFVQKCNLTSPIIDNLFDWANNWVDEILVKKKTTKFFDRDVTSAILCHYILKLSNRLKININIEVIDEFLEYNIKNNYYFGNIIYTALILLATYDFRDRIKSFNNVLSNLKNSVSTQLFFSDAKNIVFGSILFNELGETEILKHFVEHCLNKIVGNNIRFDDRVFYAWTLWNFRKLAQDKIMIIRDFIETTLDNFGRILKRDAIEDNTILDFYGEDVKPSFSKIALEFCLDLVIDYNSKKLQSSVIDAQLILKRIDSLGWTEITDMIRKALQFFDEGKTMDACNNLRMALISTLVKTVERTTGNHVALATGQTPNPKELLKPLVEKKLITERQQSLMVNTWSYVSELAHVEKKGGAPPTENETRYGFQLVLAAVELLVRALTP